MNHRLHRSAAITAPLLLAAVIASTATFVFAAGAPGDAAPAQAASPTPMRLPPDLVFGGDSGSGMTVTFHHSTHVDFAGRKCTPCHPEPFKMLHPAHRTSHQEMNAGRSCGTCHDGRSATSTKDQSSCSNCHQETGSADAGNAGIARSAPQAGGAPQRTTGVSPSSPAPAAAGPRDIKLPRSDASPGVVVFRHSSHAAPKAKCADCHPALFTMKAGATGIANHSVFHEKKCGSCHNGKRAFGTDDMDKCQSCHSAEGVGK